MFRANICGPLDRRTVILQLEVFTQRIFVADFYSTEIANSIAARMVKNQPDRVFTDLEKTG